MGLKLWNRKVEEERTTWPAVSFNAAIAQLASQFGYAGNTYTLPSAKQEEIRDFSSLVRLAYKGDSVVFACMDVRAKLFSEASFQWRNKTTKKLFGSSDLEPLEFPWPGGTTGDLLYRMLQQVDLAGNAFVASRPPGVALLRPDWVDIVAASPNSDASAWDVDAEVIGYVYHPRGRQGGEQRVFFQPNQVAHFAPIPDPEARFRGMSWLTPVIREVMADRAATDHKLMFFESGATPQMIVKFDLDAVEKMRPFIELFKEGHEGSGNAYKTLFLGAGTDATVVGKDLHEMDFKITQGAGETRIAAAAGVPPVVVGLSEGLQAATYSNYSQARRRFSEGTVRPLWRNLCGSLANILTVPGGAELWYDDRDIPALKEDIQDKAKEMQEKASAANQLVSAGYTRESIILALDAGDFTLLVPDPNPPSVQLQTPKADTVSNPGQAPTLPVPVTDGATNGSTPTAPTPA
jgi:phage portal protein BeeE